MTEGKHHYGEFIFNHRELIQPYAEVTSEATELFNDFLASKLYGSSIRVFKFLLWLEPDVDYDKQDDGIYTRERWAYLTAHLDYHPFIKATKSEKLKQILNASLFLLKFWRDKLRKVKDLRLNELIVDYTAFLDQKRLLLSDTEISQSIIKAHDSIRFSFTHTFAAGVESDKILIDFHDIEKFINNQIVGYSFGSSIQTFRIGYEIYDFNIENGWFEKTKGHKIYSASSKDLVVVRQFDYSKLQFSKHQQFQELKLSILSGILDVENMSRKPKDFDCKAFHVKMQELLSSYAADRII